MINLIISILTDAIKLALIAALVLTILAYGSFLYFIFG